MAGLTLELKAAPKRKARQEPGLIERLQKQLSATMLIIARHTHRKGCAERALAKWGKKRKMLENKIRKHSVKTWGEPF